MKKGKKYVPVKKGNKSPSAGMVIGTPEEIDKIISPKIERAKQFVRALEKKNAQEAMKEWEITQAKERKRRRGVF